MRVYTFHVHTYNHRAVMPLKGGQSSKTLPIIFVVFPERPPYQVTL